MRRVVLLVCSVLGACGQSAPLTAPSTPSPAAPAPPVPTARPEPTATTPPPPAARDHLVTEADGDQYWVIYRRDDSECDFVRLPAGGAAPTTLFTDGLGDFAETECETSIAVNDDGTVLYYLHGDEVRGVTIARPTEVEVLARGERFPRELLVAGGQLAWLALGADPYEDDMTGVGALRAITLPRGTPRDLVDGLTEPLHLRREGDELLLDDGGEESRERRVRLD